MFRTGLLLLGSRRAKGYTRCRLDHFSVECKISTSSYISFLIICYISFVLHVCQIQMHLLAMNYGEGLCFKLYRYWRKPEHCGATRDGSFIIRNRPPIRLYNRTSKNTTCRKVNVVHKGVAQKEIAQPVCGTAYPGT